MAHDALDVLFQSWNLYKRQISPEHQFAADMVKKAKTNPNGLSWLIVPVQKMAYILFAGVPFYKLTPRVASRAYPGANDLCRIVRPGEDYYVMELLDNTDKGRLNVPPNLDMDLLRRETLIHACQPDVETAPYEILLELTVAYFRIMMPPRYEPVENGNLNIINAMRKFVSAWEGVQPSIVTARPWHEMCVLDTIQWIVEQKFGKVTLPTPENQYGIQPANPTEENVIIMTTLAGAYRKATFAMDVFGFLDEQNLEEGTTRLNTTEPDYADYDAGAFGKLGFMMYAYAPLSREKLEFIDQMGQASIEFALLLANFSAQNPDKGEGLVSYTHAHLAIVKDTPPYCNNYQLTAAIAKRLRVGYEYIPASNNSLIMIVYLLTNCALASELATSVSGWNEWRQCFFEKLTAQLETLFVEGFVQEDMTPITKGVFMCNYILNAISGPRGNPDRTNYENALMNKETELVALATELYNIQKANPTVWPNCFDESTYAKIPDAAFIEMIQQLLDWQLIYYYNGNMPENGASTLAGAKELERIV